MEIWTIYERPKDYPDEFVARCWNINGTGCRPGELIRRPDLEALRGEMRERGLVALPRSYGDDPAIVECWL